ncbi:MAG: fibronectin type III domain-containing protein [Anaerovoracaceae bacterium]
MKKKLIAIVAAVLMVATMIPATAFAAEPAEPAAVTAARTAIIEVAGSASVADTVVVNIEYTPAVKTKLDDANAKYKALSKDDKVALGDAYVTRLDKANGYYKAYTDVISTYEKNFEAVTKINEGDDQDTAKPYGKALTYATTAEVVAVTAAVITGGDDGKATGAKLGATALDNAGVVAAANATTKAKITDCSAALTEIAAIKTATAAITTSKYESATELGALKTAEEAYAKLTTPQQALVGNAGKLVTARNNIAKWTKEVKDTAALYTADVEAFDNAGATLPAKYDLAKVKADLAKLEAAYNALDTNLQTKAKAVVGLNGGQITDQTFTQVKATIAKAEALVTDQAAADAVIAKIKDLTNIKTDFLKHKETILNVIAAYNALTNEGEAIVDATSYAVDLQAIATKLSQEQDAADAVTTAKTDAVRVSELNNMVGAIQAKLGTNKPTKENKFEVLEAVSYFNTVAGSGAGMEIDTTTGKVDTTNGYDKAKTWQKMFANADGASTDVTDKTAKSLAYTKLLEYADRVINMDTQDAAVADAALAKLASYVGNGTYITSDAKLANAETLLAKAEKEYNALSDAAKTEVKNFANIAKTKEEIAIYKDVVGIKAAYDTVAKLDPATITNTDLEANRAIIAAAATVLEQCASHNHVANVVKTAYDNAYNNKYDNDTAKITDLSTKLKAIDAGTAASAIEKKIAALVEGTKDDTKAQLLEKQSKLDAVNKEFAALSDAGQSAVSNASKLKSVEKSIKTNAKTIANAEMKAIGKLDAKGMTEDQLKQFKALNETLKAFGITGADLTVTDIGYPTYAQLDAAATKLQDDELLKAGLLMTALPEAADITKGKIDVVNEAEAAYKVLDAAQIEKFNLRYDTDGKITAKLKACVKAANALQFKNATIDPIKDQTATGKKITPAVTVKDANGTVVPSADYELTVTDEFDYSKTGTVSFKVRANEDSKYTGSKVGTFEIVPSSISKATVSGVANKTYTKKALTQKITVKLGKKTLKNGTDYKVSYSNNKNIGKATAKISGTGIYAGSVSKSFKINPAKTKITSLKAGSKKFSVKYSALKGEVKYQISYKTTSSNSYKTVNTSSTNKVVKNLSKGKSYNVKVRGYKSVSGTTYYGAYSNTKTIKVK